MTSSPSPSPIASRSPGAAAAWLIWLMAALFYCYGFFQRVAPSVMVSELMRDFAVGGAVMGTLSAFYFYAYAGLQVPIGVMIDRFGPKRMLIAAGVLCAAGSVSFALAPGIGPAYVGRALIGAGAGCTWVSALKLAGNWFPAARFGMLTGMTLAFGMAGAVGGQAPLALAVEANRSARSVYDDYQGFRAIWINNREALRKA